MGQLTTYLCDDKIVLATEHVVPLADINGQTRRQNKGSGIGISCAMSIDAVNE